MNILHLLSSNSFSGAENVVCTIINNNKEYNMYYYSPSGSIDEVLKKNNIKQIKGNLNPFSIKKIIKKYKIDIIHAHDFKASFVIGLIRFKGIRISHLHNNPPFIKKWNIYTILYSLVLKKFDKIVLVSKEVLNDAIFRKKIKSKYSIINNVIDISDVIEKSKINFNKMYDIAFIGRITEQKNPIFFIKIINELINNDCDVNAVMIGSGNLEEECKKLISEYNLNKRIDMIGFKDNPFCILKNSKIIIMPSVFEGFGLTAIEGMCLEIPVVNSGVGGLETIFANNQEFICNSILEYTKLCNDLLRDEKLYKKYQKNCKKIVKKYTDITSWKKEINNLYSGGDLK